MKNYILILILLAAFFGGCRTHKEKSVKKTVVISDTNKRWSYNKVLKSTNYDIKYKYANEYYKKGKYQKALELFSQIAPHERGLKRGEEVAFKEAMCNHKIGDNLYAGYLFKTFYQTYPTSSYAEEALFMSAYCYYLQAPRWSLDQKYTYEALSQFQFFIAKFPFSYRNDTINYFVEKLNDILRKKSFENAMLYYYLEYLKAAEIALFNAILEFPESEYREQMYYTLCKTSYEYAQNSMQSKQKERFMNTLSYCNDYLSLFPNGKYAKDVSKMTSIIEKKIKL